MILTLTSNTVITANFGSAPPLIVVQPLSHTVPTGSNVTLSVSATGSLPLSFQWFDGTNLLSGQTGSNLTLVDATAATAGNYIVVVSNYLGAVTSSTSRLSVMTPTIYWIGAGDGQSWNDPNNWNPAVLPTPTDSIFIGGAGLITNVPAGLTVSNLLCQPALALTNSLTVNGAVDVASNLYLASGLTLTVSGSNAVLIAEGPTTADGVGLYVGLGGTISFPGLTSLNGGTNMYNVLEAGPGGLLDLSSVQRLTVPEGNIYYYGIKVQADAGGVVNLSGVTNVTGNASVDFDATAANGRIILSGLRTFTCTGELHAANGGAILAANVNSLSGVSLYVDGASTLVLTGLTNYSGYNVSTLEAGPGAVLDLSSVQTMTGPVEAYSGLAVRADVGAVVNLGGVTNLTGPGGVPNNWISF